MTKYSVDNDGNVFKVKFQAVATFYDDNGYSEETSFYAKSLDDLQTAVKEVKGIADENNVKVSFDIQNYDNNIEFTNTEIKALSKELMKLSNKTVDFSTAKQKILEKNEMIGNE